MEDGVVDLDDADATFQHEVPAEGHFYLGTQCFQCANPPCVKVCPVGATWQEPDGIIVIDYDWCIGCRYCMAACPYWARRFNWSAPEVPAEEVNPNQHYLGNRARKKGVVEKCTFCIHRTRQGRLPACAEACPTGARVFGNLLDPDSEIRWVLANKQRLPSEGRPGDGAALLVLHRLRRPCICEPFLLSALRSATSGDRRYHLWMGSLTADHAGRRLRVLRPGCATGSASPA